MQIQTTKKALIIEDEPSIAIVCERVLSNEGFKVDIANDDEAAEEIVPQKDYNLILVNIGLPVSSGFDFYVWLSQEFPHLKQRVIFMTGSIMDGDNMSLLTRIGRSYLLKPFRPDELKSIVTDFINKSQ